MIEEVKVRFRLKTAGLGYHPDVPTGTVFIHPATLPLFRNFIVEGDYVLINDNDALLEVISSDLAFPPIFQVKKGIISPDKPEDTEELINSGGKLLYVGGFLLHGDKFIPPLKDIDGRSFRLLVEMFKGELDTLLLSYHGIPPTEKYLHMVGPFFGYHIPDAVQQLDEGDWRDLSKKWGGSVLDTVTVVDIALMYHLQNEPVETGVHGFYPVKTPYPVFVCEKGCISPFEVCPLCGGPTKPAKICVACGRVYPLEKDRCPYDGSTLVERATHDPKPIVDRFQEMYGKVGEVVFVDGEPEHPLKAYYRKKTNLTVGRSGVVELNVVPFPGERNLLPRVLVDPILRIYRFLRLVTKDDSLPETRKDIIGRKVVILIGKNGYPVTIEGIGDNRFELRKEIFYSLPSKKVRIAVYEDVMENGRGIQINDLPEGKNFPYTPYPSRSIFEGENRPERLLELYNEVVDILGADPSMAIPLLFPILKEKEAMARRTLLYRCTDCGTEYSRVPLAKKCPKCGGRIERVRDIVIPDIDELVNRYSNNPKIYEYLLLFKRRLKGKGSQRSLLELF